MSLEDQIFNSGNDDLENYSDDDGYDDGGGYEQDGKINANGSKGKKIKELSNPLKARRVSDVDQSGFRKDSRLRKFKESINESYSVKEVLTLIEEASTKVNLLLDQLPIKLLKAFHAFQVRETSSISKRKCQKK